jgi:glycosyltransferase involved in cell wall biosynthesis
MRIARIRHLFYPDIPQDYFYELSARQAKTGNNVSVYTWSKEGEFSSEITPEGFTIHRLPGLDFGLGGFVNEYPYLIGLSSQLEAFRPDVVHAESHLFLPTFQAIKKAKKMNLACLVTVHGLYAERGKALNFIQFAYLRTMGLFIFKRTDRVICLTQSEANEVIKYGCAAEKVRVIPNAIDIERFAPGIEREGKLIVWVGRFVIEKGLEYLVKAAEKIAKKMNNTNFLLIGYGPLKGKIEQLIHERGLSNTIRIIGPLSRNQIASILGKATLFAFPSLREGLPLSVLEAMACGTPVVGSDIPGVRSIITNGQNGLLVSPRNPEALANAIWILLEDESLRKRLGQNARRTVEEKYNWNTVLSMLEEVYREIL